MFLVIFIPNLQTILNLQIVSVLCFLQTVLNLQTVSIFTFFFYSYGPCPMPSLLASRRESKDPYLHAKAPWWPYLWFGQSKSPLLFLSWLFYRL